MKFNNITNYLQTIFNKTEKKGNPLNLKIVKSAIQRGNHDVSTLNSAIISAESPSYPNRRPLYNIYNNIINDAHLSSVIQQRKNKTLSSDFKIIDKDGKKNNDLIKIFRSSWFQDFVSHALDSRFWGFSLIELGDIESNKIEKVSLINRYHVFPEKGYVQLNLNDSSNLIYYNQQPASTWLIPVGNAEDLGLLRTVAKIMLFKSHVMNYQMEFTQLFGMPFRFGQTDDDKQSMGEMLENMAEAGWGVFGKDDVIKFIESNNAAGGAEVYHKFLEWINSEASKAIVGQTLTTDNGSSYSQANVHENVGNQVAENDKRFIQYVVNDVLIPKLIDLGFDLEGYEFIYFNEVFSKKEQFEMTVKLIENGKDVPDDFILENFGIPVTTIKQPDQPVNFQKPL